MVQYFKCIKRFYKQYIYTVGKEILKATTAHNYKMTGDNSPSKSPMAKIRSFTV